MTQTLQVRLLGRVEVLVDGRPVDLPGRRPRALLAVLALSAGEPVPVESLYERVFGRDLSGDVRANLYTCVRRLRKALGDNAIVNESGRYSLMVEPDDVDAVRFMRLVDRTRAVGADSEPLLREALDLWQGAPFGAEPLSDWLDEDESRRLTERWLAAVQERIDLDLVAGRSDDLVEELEQLTAAYPLREPLWARFLVALDRAGRPADALVAYERIRVRLVDELGIDPSQELQDLYAVLLRGESPTITGSAPVTRTVPRQLPSDTAGFTGREHALADLDGLLTCEPGARTSSVVIAALHGMGGVGKTTLAVHWAHRIADRFPDGQLFVNLRGYGPSEPLEPAAALDLLLRGLGLPGEKIPADSDARAALLRSTVAGKRLLFVLDDARDAEQVRPLLPGSGSLVLVTSRSQLRGLAARDGARRIALDALPMPEALALLRSRLAPVPTDDSLAELADLCGRLPLALTIAAERANQHPYVGLSDLIAELCDEQDRLDALADVGDPLADVRAVLSWSFRTLDAGSAGVLRHLGLAPAHDLSLDAVAALCGLPVTKTRHLLDRLVAASLVGSGDHRYRLHDLVRTYANEQAREQLTEADRDQARQRFFQWCVRATTDARLAFNPGVKVVHPVEELPDVPSTTFGDPVGAIAWLEREDDLLMSVAYDAAASDPWVTVGIAHMLWSDIRWRRSWDDAIALQELALSCSQRLGDRAAEAQTLNVLGLVHLTAIDFDRAVAYFERACAVYEQMGDLNGQSRVLSNLGVLQNHLGRPAAAVAIHQRALTLAIQLGDGLKAADTRNNLVYGLVALSLHDQAVVEAELTLEEYRQVGSAIDQAMALDTLGQALHARGDHQAALDCLTEAVQLARDPFIPRPLAVIMANLARCQHAVGQDAAARSTIQSTFALIEEHDLSDGYEIKREDLVELLAAATHGRQSAGR